MSEKRLLVATDITSLSSKSLASAVTSIYSGISISSFSSPSVRLRLSFNPGIAAPITILLSFTCVTLPLVTSILENLSFGRTIPVSIVNGTYAVCVLPFTVIVFFSLLV